MTTRNSNCIRLYVVCLMCTIVCAAGSSNEVIFNTEMIGGSTFAVFPDHGGIFANNWVMPALSPGRHVVQVQWRANLLGSPQQGDVYALGSSLIVQHGP
jgi:hypothetical protein